MSSRTVPRCRAANAKAESGTAGETRPPRIDDPQSVAPQDARRLTAVFFRRLQELEEGTADYQYARNTLIELSLPLVGFVAKRFQDRDDQYEDIRQVGTIGLIKAIDRFDLSREVEFSTFAIPYIAGEIKRFFRDTTWAVHVPRRLQEQRIALARATDRLEARLGRAPTTQELAEAMEVSAGEVTEAVIASNAYSTHSLNLSSEDEGEAKEVNTLLGRLGRWDPALEKVENLNSLKPLLAELEERDRRILEMHFGEELTQQQIGDVLGLSQMHVSRLLRRCLGELRAGLTQG
ncbi:SigB/SigF/SigG family RNA polymerase sigma factor [Streptomyces sp. WMMB 322]|uniref:SigB/SigF/SigG family RNA polymerase sigma factor n=1 Tax=Streptomyces sp. WMMB 322 TaxID=1286821 RepID=UPI0006E2F1FF|nr:SigB/SigF/SigG family RNA polymerase sigma factor [Streptomyces sp. WMMB 322]SCK48325.1 RNA polymerase sigma-B factor [Streptomyces sp. WMMB 322]